MKVSLFIRKRRQGMALPVAVVFVALAAPGMLTGCGVSARESFGGASVTPDAVLTGRIQGGQQPIQNAAIYLYAAGTAGNGTGASNLLNQSVFTASDGSFSITSDYSCPAAQTQVYLVASGGNPGISPSTNNAASVMMAALGDCGSLSASTYVFVDEVTTAAAAWALSQFIGPSANIGASSTNANGLRNAFLIANSLANTTTGQAGGSGLPTASSTESRKLYALANALSGCVNSNGGASCSPLFAAATVGTSAPANILDAALNIVRNPAHNVTAVFNAGSPTSPFQPSLSAAPHDWTMSITYTGGAISYPTAVALDSTGSAWIANYFGGVATKLSATGVPASATGYADPSLNESYGIAVDTSDSAWVTNEQGNSYSGQYAGTISKFNSSGTLLSGIGFATSIYFPYSIAAVSNGDMWVADYGRSQASLLDNNGNSLAGTNGYSSLSLPLPVGVAVDGSHDGWFATEGAASMVTPGGTITEYTCCKVTSAIALDQNGAVWISDYGASAVVQISSTGSVWQTYKSAGVFYPEDLAIDGAGSVWVSNFRGNTISGLTGATGGATSTAISPTAGFGLDAGLVQPFGIALDASGNIWVTNFAGNSVTQFVGLASPVKTPMLGLPAAP
jgi:streptogramin lyase